MRYTYFFNKQGLTMNLCTYAMVVWFIESHLNNILYEIYYIYKWFKKNNFVIIAYFNDVQ
jgi:hypothetical protein